MCSYLGVPIGVSDALLSESYLSFLHHDVLPAILLLPVAAPLPLQPHRLEPHLGGTGALLHPRRRHQNRVILLPRATRSHPRHLPRSTAQAARPPMRAHLPRLPLCLHRLPHRLAKNTPCGAPRTDARGARPRGHLPRQGKDTARRHTCDINLDELERGGGKGFLELLDMYFPLEDAVGEAPLRSFRGVWRGKCMALPLRRAC
jgi:hypothetical protein